MDRRRFLRAGGAAGGLALLGLVGARQAGAQAAPAMAVQHLAQQEVRRFGPLRAPDGNDLQLPAGFRSRIVATTGDLVGDTGYRWHPNPDGGATFPADDGGWIYVSNDEASEFRGGASMVRFDRAGDIVEARKILDGTNRNCAGGPMPWGTWLSCEEFDGGRVWECDPSGRSRAQVRPAMGTFAHEAAAADPARQVVYLTEDKPDGALYRFLPRRWGDLSSGTLQAMVGRPGDAVAWQEIPDPTASAAPTRRQLGDVRVFDGGEGAWYGDDRLYFTTKGDNRVWCYSPDVNRLEIVYDIDTSPNPILRGVDNVALSAAGDLFVCEDGGNMEVVAIHTDGSIEPVVRMNVAGSEVTGVAFDPSGTRMYVSSQRNPGRTFEITGPFLPAAPPEPSPTPTPGAPEPDPAGGDSAAGPADRSNAAKVERRSITLAGSGRERGVVEGPTESER